MTRPAACISCRQDKLRCNASASFPSPCWRCAQRNIMCKIDTYYKRVRTRNRLEQLSQELDRVKRAVPTLENSELRPNLTDPTQNNSLPVVYNSPKHVGSSDTNINRPFGNILLPREFTAKLDDIVLCSSDVEELFKEYMLYYHQQFPVLDVDIEPISTLNACPLLFWCIVVTASRNLPLQQDLFRDLCKLLPSLLSELMIQRTTSVHSIQALLILSMWPLPVQRQSEDMRWIHSGIAMQMALQAGLHQVGYEHEYRAFTGFRNHNDEQKHTRIWRCWCFVNAILSCELGLPCLVPFDALELKPTDEAALPAEFSSRLRIALYISRINDALGHSVLKENGHEMRMIRLFEKDLNSLVIELRHSPTQWNDRVEFVYLGVILNLYSFYLRHSSSKSPDQPEYSIMKSSASRCASKAVQIYANSSFSLAEEPSLGSCWQRYCPKFYFGVALSAVFMLLKISALNELPTPELEDINNTIKLGHNTLISCSCTKGDEYQRAARVIEILCKRGVLDSAQGKYPVESRLGASLSYELLVAAVRWRKQGGDQIHHNPNNLASGGVTTATSDTRSIIADPTSSLINPYDWSNRFDFTQADLGLGSDSNWWGGQIFEVDILSFIRLLIHLWKVLIREKTMEPHIFDFSFAMQDCAGAIPEPSDIELV